MKDEKHLEREARYVDMEIDTDGEIYIDDELFNVGERGNMA